MQGNMEDIKHRQTAPWLRGHPPRAARTARSRNTVLSYFEYFDTFAPAASKVRVTPLETGGRYIDSNSLPRLPCPGR